MPESPIDADAQNDGILMDRIARSDPDALAALYDRHSPTVMAFCARLLGSRSDAEDVLGEVFWQIWEQADRYDVARGSPIAFIMTIARTRALDRLRAAGRARRRFVDADAGVIEAVAGRDSASSAGPSVNPLDEAMVGEQRARVSAALNSLDPQQRKAVELSFFEDLSHTEIAERLGEPLGTVKSRIRTGLLRLRDGLRAQYAPEGRA